MRRLDNARRALEAVPAEERGLEGEAEDPRNTEVAGVLQQLDEHRRTQAVALEVRPHRHRAHLGEVLPHDVQSAAADHLALDLDDPELVDRLVYATASLVTMRRVVVIGSTSDRIARTSGCGPAAPRPHRTSAAGQRLAQQVDERVELDRVAGAHLLVAAVERASGQPLLAVDELGDPAVDGLGREDPPRGDRLVLADPVDAVDRLLLLGRGPGELGEDDVRRGVQVEADACAASRKHSDRDLRVLLERVDSLLALVAGLVASNRDGPQPAPRIRSAVSMTSMCLAKNTTLPTDRASRAV